MDTSGPNGGYWTFHSYFTVWFYTNADSKKRFHHHEVVQLNMKHFKKFIGQELTGCPGGPGGPGAPAFPTRPAKPWRPCKCYSRKSYTRATADRRILLFSVLIHQWLHWPSPPGALEVLAVHFPPSCQAGRDPPTSPRGPVDRPSLEGLDLPETMSRLYFETHLTLLDNIIHSQRHVVLTFKPGGPTRPDGPGSPTPFSPCNTDTVNTETMRRNLKKV